MQFVGVKLIGGTMTPGSINSGDTWGHKLEGDCFIPGCIVRVLSGARFAGVQPGLILLECELTNYLVAS